LIVAGVALGLLLPTNPELRGGYARVSNVLGYTYFLAWTVSFYPQVCVLLCVRVCVFLL
jgi:hypothetical protein